MSFASLHNTDDLLGSIVADVPSPAADAFVGTPIETTGRVLSSLVGRLDALKTAVVQLAESGNLYAASALFRVFLEHILKANAIFQKSLEDQSNDFAEQYTRMHIKEAFDYLKACGQAGIEIGDAPKTVLDQWIPEAQSLSSNQIKKLEEPFRYRSLIATIREAIGATSPDFLLKIIPNYSELSGFVHGGPSANDKVLSVLSSNGADAELFRMADLAVAMLYSAHRWLLMMLSECRPEFQDVLQRLDHAMANFE